MNRAVIQLWPALIRAFIAAAAGMVLVWPFAILGLCSGLFAPTGAWGRFRWLQMLGASVRQFRTLRTSSVTLHYSPLVRDQLVVRAFAGTVEMELRSLARKFGRRLQRRVAVYLFADRAEVSRIRGRQFGGFALCEANAIVLSPDCIWDEFVRHELSHLFADRWSKTPPPLLQEGLAVWLQDTHYGKQIDDAARAVLDRREVELDVLTDRSRFFSAEYMSDCYTLAGSFTAFLVHRFGWEAYRRLYRQCDGRRFRAKFRKCFGTTLEDAHWEWRLELRLFEGPAAGLTL